MSSLCRHACLILEAKEIELSEIVAGLQSEEKNNIVHYSIYSTTLVPCLAILEKGYSALTSGTNPWHTREHIQVILTIPVSNGKKII